MTTELTPRDRLRRDTRATHDALENLPIMLLLMSPLVTREAYAGLLQALYSAYARYCPHIEAALDGCRHPALVPTQLLEFLEQDLQALGRWPVEQHLDLALPALTTELEALGAWYVLEGSALGGVVIGSRLRATLGDDLPVCYLADRDGSTERWQQFDDFLEDKLRQPDSLEPITAGANASYEFSTAAMAAAT